MRILLFRTVRTEFLSFCIDACRDRFAGSEITLIAQNDVPMASMKAKVDNVITILPGMMSPRSIPEDVWNKISDWRPDIAVVPVYNPKLQFYRRVWHAARRTGVRKVLGLNLDGSVFKMTRRKYILRSVLDSRLAGIGITFMLAPYAAYLLCKSWILQRHIQKTLFTHPIGPE